MSRNDRCGCGHICDEHADEHGVCYVDGCDCLQWSKPTPAEHLGQFGRAVRQAQKAGLLPRFDGDGE